MSWWRSPERGNDNDVSTNSDGGEQTSGASGGRGVGAPLGGPTCVKRRRRRGCSATSMSKEREGKGGVQIGTHAKEEEGIGIHVEREMGV
jgi:hypothetical protein